MAKKSKAKKFFHGTFSGRAKVFRNEREADGDKFYTYSAAISQKDKDGNYQNASIDVTFKRGEEPEYWEKGKRSDGTAYYCADIDITDAFLTFRKYKDHEGRTITRWVCMVIDWDEPEEEF